MSALKCASAHVRRRFANVTVSPAVAAHSLKAARPDGKQPDAVIELVERRLPVRKGQEFDFQSSQINDLQN